MKIGICTRFCGHEATEAALAIADWGVRAGHDMTLLPLRTRPGWVQEADHLNCRRGPFSDWARSCDVVIWTHIPHIEQLLWVREQKKHASIFALWAEWLPGDDDIMCSASSILCPTRAAASLATRLRLPTAFTGFQSWLPPVQRGTEAPGARILFPMHAGWLYRTEMTAIDVLARALHRCPGASATILYSASTLAGFARNRLQRFRRHLGGRLRLQKVKSRQTYIDALLRHDILYWPSHIENTCYLGLAASLLGAVPVTLRISPISEVFTDDSAVLVPCQAGATRAGVPVAAPDYNTVEVFLRGVVEDRVGLLRRRREGLRIAKDRRILFEDSLTHVFG